MKYLILLSCLTFAACDPIPEQKSAFEQQQAERAKDAQRCRDGGGIPITSAWDGRIIDCKAVPKP